MKKIILISWLMSSLTAFAQTPETPRPFGFPTRSFACDTRPRSAPVKVAANWQDRTARKAGVLPYCIKVYLTVFADNNGSNRASTDADQLRHFKAMVTQYAPHNICFVLMGLRQVNNSDLNAQDADEEDELAAFLIPGAFNIFTHQQVLSNGTIVGGTAYDIPNTGSYVSLSGPGNVSNPQDFNTMAHEVGHAFGLYHTFTTTNGAENVARSGSCKDCDDDGDLLCDTPADPDQQNSNNLLGSYLAANTNMACLYTGNRTDDCGVPFVPATNNIMSYGANPCITQFTAGQGNRMRYFLANESDFASVLAPEFVATPVLGPVIRSVGEFDEAARDVLTVGEIQPYLVQQTAQVEMQAKRIVLKPGVRFTPGAGGRVQVKVNPNCQ